MCDSGCRMAAYRCHGPYGGARQVAFIVESIEDCVVICLVYLVCGLGGLGEAWGGRFTGRYSDPGSPEALQRAAKMAAGSAAGTVGFAGECQQLRPISMDGLTRCLCAGATS